MLWKKLMSWCLSVLFALSAVPAERTNKAVKELSIASAQETEAGSATMLPRPQLPDMLATPSVDSDTGWDDLQATASEPTAAPSPSATPMPPAEDITLACEVNGYTGDIHPTNMRDGVYKSYWQSTKQDGIHSFSVRAPAGKTIGGILIRWQTWPMAVAVQVRQNDEWVTVASCDADFMAQYIPLPELTDFRVVSRDDEGGTRLGISEITIMTPGELPEDFQVWRKPPEKIDLMLLATHPDDEILWFGGLLPTYAGDQGKDVLVVCAAHNSFYRRLELCDCLWACGVTIYPAFLSYGDVTYANIMKIYEKWGGRKKVRGDIVRLYRQYRPDVVVLQAVGGESGHTAHRAFSQAGRDAVELAASAEQYPDTLELYGPWDIPKVYVHLWEENQITMDWHAPLARFGGLDGMEVAQVAFEKHTSQQGKSQYFIHDGGETDCSLFGLFHTTVGLDEAGNDLFEHIPPRGE